MIKTKARGAAMNGRLPEWFSRKLPAGRDYIETLGLVKEHGLNTVCESAKCPNIGECFAKRRATFLIMGSTCTRNCGFCGVDHGKPGRLDEGEPEKIAEILRGLYLKYAVITSVTRDDLPDGGASHFTAVMAAIRNVHPEMKIELLTPDFKGDIAAIKRVVEANPDVLAHNMETVRALYGKARAEADYDRSLRFLADAKKIDPGQVTKSGFMVGLGETEKEIDELMKDLVASGCDILTIGQYLRPSRECLPVAEFVPPEKFVELKSRGEALGFKKVVSGPLVRSSYMADTIKGDLC